MESIAIEAAVVAFGFLSAILVFYVSLDQEGLLGMFCKAIVGALFITEVIDIFKGAVS